MRWPVASVVAGLVAACATSPPPRPPPRLEVSAKDSGPVGAACGARVEPGRGARPTGTRVVSTVMVTADRPVSLESLEQAALVPALRRCASGLSVLRAEAADGTDGYVSLTAEAWDLVVEDPPQP